MKVSLNSPAFTANTPQKRKDAEKKAVVGGGALAVVHNQAAKRGISAIGNINKGTQAATNATRGLAKLWSKVSSNIKYVQNAVKGNRLFKWFATPLGYAFGAITLVSGLADIGKAATDTLDLK